MLLAQDAEAERPAATPPAAPPTVPPEKPPVEPAGNTAVVTAIPAQMTLKKPLATEEQLENQLKELRRSPLSKVMIDAQWNDAARQWVPKWVKYRTELMTLDKVSSPTLLRELKLDPKSVEGPVEVRPYLYILRDETLRDIANCGLSQTNVNEYRTFRNNLCSAMVAACDRLMDNNFYVRLNAVILMAKLNETEEHNRLKTPEKPFQGAAEALLRVATDPKQLDAVKIPAVLGLQRILLGNRPRDNDLKNRIARGLIHELERPETFFWYQIRLGQTLAALDLSQVNEPNATAKPLIVHTLMTVMADEKRDPRVRAEMAWSLGRVPIDQSVNMQLVAFELTNLAQQFANGYNKQRPGEYYWPECFWKLYLAFQPGNDEDKRRYDKPGLLSRFPQGPIKDAYGVVLPVLKHVLEQDPKQKAAPVPKEVLQGTSAWLEQHKPANYRVFPDGEPLRPVMAAR